MPNMKGVSLSFIQGLAEDYSLGENHSAIRKLFQRGRGKPVYI